MRHCPGSGGTMNRTHADEHRRTNLLQLSLQEALCNLPKVGEGGQHHLGYTLDHRKDSLPDLVPRSLGCPSRIDGKKISL